MIFIMTISDGEKGRKTDQMENGKNLPEITKIKSRVWDKTEPIQKYKCLPDQWQNIVVM
eukprot:gnl/Chilomastix_caulleri/1655.p2 GENE.gnl/Chilomastix_caulleri/1655~~gnl/Chilomastix_caulleri/1655.p2  ORF type:complete len:59 (-),score=2.47 gnl/Chilomastix_caulleri/1655:162-338(-)